MITLRSFRNGAGIFVGFGFLVSCLYLLSQAFHTPRQAAAPVTAADLQVAAYNRLISLPISASVDLAYGSLALPHRRLCHPFLFPRPTSTLFVTAWPNHGAGVGHQFGEWLYGPAVALMLNISYAHTGFLANSARWDSWLGFGAGEDSELDVRNMAMQSHLVIRNDTMHYARDNSLTMEDWVRVQLAEYRTAHGRSPASPFAVSAPSALVQVAADPATDVTLLRIYRVHVPFPSRRYSCYPELNLLLRRKYCVARVRVPVAEELYKEDREAQRTVVAFHLRCGDSCFNPARATPLPSVIRTIRLMADTLVSAGLTPAFHLFSQPPDNETAEEHFRPVTEGAELRGVQMTTHWYAHSHTTLHHLVTADVLIGAQSSFSWLSSLLHHTVAMGPVDTCRWQVQGYDRLTGEFNGSSLLRQLHASRLHAPRFRTLDDCHALRRWDEGLEADELGYDDI